MVDVSFELLICLYLSSLAVFPLFIGPFELMLEMSLFVTKEMQRVHTVKLLTNVVLLLPDVARTQSDDQHLRR